MIYLETNFFYDNTSIPSDDWQANKIMDAFQWTKCLSKIVKVNNKINIKIKVRSLLDHSYTILISFKIVIIFNITSADFVLI